MNSTTPKDVVIAYLSSPRVPVANVPVSNRQGWLTQQYTGGLGANLATICFLKERYTPHHYLYYVKFENEQGKQMQYACDVVEDSDGVWKLQGVSGGTGSGPQHSLPRVNLSGGNGDQFYAGGYVQHNGNPITRVCLLSANGLLLEDNVEDDIVLFLDDRQIDLPLQARLYDNQGSLVGTHQVLPG